MNWSQAKSILIIAFVILNAFLIIQLRELMNANQINIIAEATIQERLNDMNVEVKVPYNDEHLSGHHIVSRNKKIAQSEINHLVNQKATILNEETIISTLNEPVPLKEGDLESQLKQFLSSYIYQSKNYHFVRYDETKQQILFMQMYDGKVMYSLDAAPLIVQLDKDFRIVSYQQNILEVEEQGRIQEFLSSSKAIEVLLNEQLIKGDEKIEAIELGYYSFFRPLGNVQVFAPMWRIEIDGANFLVNAIDGSVQDFS